MVEDDDSCYSLPPVFDKCSEEPEEVHFKAKLRHKAPEFTGTIVFRAGFKHVDLADYTGKYLVILFYPLDFALGCPHDVLEFSFRQKEFAKINTDILAISVDSEYAHLAWSNVPIKFGGVGTLAIPLMSDLNRKISTDYGVLNTEVGHTLRGVFIIDENGILRHKSINDIFVRHSVDEILRMLSIIQYNSATAEPFGPIKNINTCKKPGISKRRIDYLCTYLKKKNDD